MANDSATDTDKTRMANIDDENGAAKKIADPPEAPAAPPEAEEEDLTIDDTPAGVSLDEMSADARGTGAASSAPG